MICGKPIHRNLRRGNKQAYMWIQYVRSNVIKQGHEQRSQSNDCIKLSMFHHTLATLTLNLDSQCPHILYLLLYSS